MLLKYQTRTEKRKLTNLIQLIFLVCCLWLTTLSSFCFAVEEAKTAEIVDEVTEAEVVDKAKDAEVVEKIKDAEVVDEATEAEVVDKVKDAEVVEKIKDAEVVDEVKDAEMVEETKGIDPRDVIEIVEEIKQVEAIKKSAAVGINDDTERTVKIIELPNGSLYSGDIKYEVIRDGKGINEWPNGDRYKGEWLNDSPHGQGYMLRKNKEEYHGQFEFGQYSGLGDLKTTTGERYIGSFRFNQLDGLGLFVSSNQSYYLGEFSQHKRHGRFLYFQSLSSKPEYQIWFNDALEKVVEMNNTQDIRDIQERELIAQMIASFTKIGKKRLSQRSANTHYQVRGRVRKIVSDVENTPEHAYGDLIINLLNLSH